MRVKGRAKGRAVEVDETTSHSVGMAKEDAWSDSLMNVLGLRMRPFLCACALLRCNACFYGS